MCTSYLVKGLKFHIYQCFDLETKTKCESTGKGFRRKALVGVKGPYWTCSHSCSS
jgi:hypothetical protein